MNFNDLSIEEIKELLSVQKVLNALLDKINSIEDQIHHNRDEIDSLSKTISDLSDRITALDVTTNNDLKQIKTDNTQISQKLFNMDKTLNTYSKQLNDIEKAFKNDKSREDTEDTKKKDNSGVNKSLREVKKIKK